MMGAPAAKVAWPAALLGLAALGWWALRPLPEPDLRLPELATAAPSAQPVQLAALDAAAFAMPLWVTPPAPPAPPPPPPPPPPLPPLKVQLIAIVSEPGAEGRPPVRCVLVYDPDLDKLLTLKEGQDLAGRTIESISEKDVRLREGAAVRTLSLVDPASTGAGQIGGRP